MSDAPIFALPLLAVGLTIVAGIVAARCRGWARLYWIGCAVAIGLGLTLTVALVVFPTEETDAAGNLIGEMPKAFGLALMMTLVGMMTTLLGLIVRRILSLIGRKPAS
jgi:hypothetical protein